MLDQPELIQQLDLTIIRLGTIETLDKYLSSSTKKLYEVTDDLQRKEEAHGFI